MAWCPARAILPPIPCDRPCRSSRLSQAPRWSPLSSSCSSRSGCTFLETAPSTWTPLPRIWRRLPRPRPRRQRPLGFLRALPCFPTPPVRATPGPSSTRCGRRQSWCRISSRTPRLRSRVRCSSMRPWTPRWRRSRSRAARPRSRARLLSSSSPTSTLGTTRTRRCSSRRAASPSGPSCRASACLSTTSAEAARSMTSSTPSSSPASKPRPPRLATLPPPSRARGTPIRPQET
mmetsp:Transcript_57841/g.136066  ORF Transcript_57841/g.136066 Transcript_57841/m.136066 type:complete len:233 (-) Transcript_57841:729-1427(-)